MTTGKVKLIAARACSPSWATNQVSMMFNDITAAMPQIMGTVWATR